MPPCPRPSRSRDGTQGKPWVFKESCGTNPVSPVKLRWCQRGFANATPDMLCAQCQRAICAKHPWAALESAARPRIETGRRSRYGGAKDMRSLLRSVSGASLIRIGVSTKIFEDPKNIPPPARLKSPPQLSKLSFNPTSHLTDLLIHQPPIPKPLPEVPVQPCPPV